MMNNRIINLAAFAILTLLWLAFAAALVLDRDMLTATWETLRGWPLVVQLAVWLLALPVTAGLWVWQTSWPLVLRLVLVAGLAWATLYTFNPWKAPGRAVPSPAPTEPS
jgi:hypothetical protein